MEGGGGAVRRPDERGLAERPAEDLGGAAGADHHHLGDPAAERADCDRALTDVFRGFGRGGADGGAVAGGGGGASIIIFDYCLFLRMKGNYYDLIYAIDKKTLYQSLLLNLLMNY